MRLGVVLGDDLRGSAFVGRVGVGLQKAHRIGLDTVRAQPRNGRAHGRLIQGDEDPAIRPGALRDADPMTAADDGPRSGKADIGEALLVPTAQLDDVPEAIGRQHAHARAGVLEHGVRRDGRPEVDDLGLVEQFSKPDLEPRGDLPQGLEDREVLLTRPRRRLARDHRVAITYADEIREGSADIDPDAVSHPGCTPILVRTPTAAVAAFRRSALRSTRTGTPSSSTTSPSTMTVRTADPLAP